MDEEIEGVVDELVADELDDDLGDALPGLTKCACPSSCKWC
jgi:hypothetical protein